MTVDDLLRFLSILPRDDEITIRRNSRIMYETDEVRYLPMQGCVEIVIGNLIRKGGDPDGKET